VDPETLIISSSILNDDTICTFAPPSRRNRSFDEVSARFMFDEVKEEE
jgi:hypothetical protein